MPEHTAINMKSPPKSSLEDVLGFLKALAATDILYANRGRVTDPFNRSVMVTLTNTESVSILCVPIVYSIFSFNCGLHCIDMWHYHNYSLVHRDTLLHLHFRFFL